MDCPLGIRRSARTESAFARSAAYAPGSPAAARSDDRACAASSALITGLPASVTCAPMPNVICCKAGWPTRDSGKFTPLTTGASSPTVAVTSVKNTTDTNVSTSGTRFS
jgi:hypothetical protein